MNSSKRTKILDIVCVLLVLMTGVIRLVRENLVQIPSNTVIFLLFITAASIWISQLQRRLVETQERKYIIAMAIMIVFLMTLRTIKFIFLPNAHFTTRYAWYLYYFPQVFMLLWMFFAVLHIGKGSNQHINRRWKLLYIPAVLLVLGVMTNDLHGLAFYFPNGIANWTNNSTYIYGPLYYLTLAWMVVLFVSILAITIVRCSVLEYRKNIWMPLLPLGVGILYIVLFLIDKNTVVAELFKAAEMICFIFPAFTESLILARLFPSNDGYPKLWHLSTIGGGIIDLNGNIRFRSKKCIDVSLEQVKSAQDKQILLNDKNTILQSHSIQAGYGYWIKDITEINKINEKLEDLGDVLAEENAILAEENKLKEKRTKIEEKNKLYDSMALSVNKQLETLSKILENLPDDELEFEKTMKYASVIGVYIKRHSNILLHLHKGNCIHSNELRFSLTESLEYLHLCGILADSEFVGEDMLNGNKALLVYEIFQAAIESDLYNINAVLVNLIIDEKITFRVQLSGAKKALDKRLFLEKLLSFNGFLNTCFEDETEYITLELPLKGECI